MHIITLPNLLDAFSNFEPLGVNDRTRSRHWVRICDATKASTIYFATTDRQGRTENVPVATHVRAYEAPLTYLYVDTKTAPKRNALTSRLHGALRKGADRGQVFYSHRPGAIPDCRYLHDHEGMAAVFNGVYLEGFIDRMEELNTRILSVYDTPGNRETGALCRQLNDLWVQYNIFLQHPYHKTVMQVMGGERWKPEFRLTRMNLGVDRFEEPFTEQELRDARALRRCTIFRNSPVLLNAFIESRPPDARPTPEQVITAVTRDRQAVMMRHSRHRKRARSAGHPGWDEDNPD